jgi:hypothetical protein
VSVGMPLVPTSVFDLIESPAFKQVREGAKSSESSRKSSNTEGRIGEMAEGPKAAVC